MLDKYREVLGTCPASTLAIELELLGCTHAQVGAYLMSIWGLPVPLVHAVAFHHNPLDTGENKFTSLTAVHAADAIASLNDSSPLNHDIELDTGYLDRLGVGDREAVWRSFYEEHLAAKPGPEADAGAQEHHVCG